MRLLSLSLSLLCIGRPIMLAAVAAVTAPVRRPPGGD